MMMKHAVNLFAVWVILLTLNGCKSYVIPAHELCLVGVNSGQCNDTRKPKTAQNYDLRFDQMTNYVCTNPSDWGEQQVWWLDKLKRLEKCQVSPKQCDKDKKNKTKRKKHKKGR